MRLNRKAALLGATLALALTSPALAGVSNPVVTRSDTTLDVQWTAAPDEAVDVYQMTRPGQRGRLVSRADTDGRHSVPVTGQRTYFAVQSADGARRIVGERVVRLYGASNFRDLGGYETSDGRRVRWGAIFRSAALNGLQDQDRPTLLGLNIATIYDLRSNGERASEPTRWPWGRRPAMDTTPYDMDTAGFAAPLGDNPTPEGARALMTSFYPRLIDSHKQQFSDVFEGLLRLRPGRAFVFHCTAGKDRTGVATALVLSTLGVPRETILDDFELSNQNYRPRLTPASRGASEQTNPMASLPRDVLAVFMGVDRAYLIAFFDAVETRYGSVENYLATELGVSAEEQARLRTMYTEA
jgi:protein-tyrosine phosphatase